MLKFNNDTLIIGGTEYTYSTLNFSKDIRYNTGVLIPYQHGYLRYYYTHSNMSNLTQGDLSNG